MSFENDKYPVEKDPYELCLRQSKILKAIYLQMNIQMRNHKLLTKIPGEPDHAVKCRCKQSFTLDDIANILQDLRERTNIGKYFQFKSSSFKEKKPFRVELKNKPKENMEEVTKKKKTFYNCGSTDNYSNNCQKAKKKVYYIEKFPEKEFLTEDSESESMGDAITEQSDDEQYPREKFLVEYKEEKQLNI
ncbi:hypothetical protein O181_037629 [Austropuccinia psidii MF-1]|uniref:Uncharacterized protein n=1 Tax=Austropuccinia psidii MF-1 TaxID=1389203 RepID=A0A9Q3D6R6_9BASI|nr:hypothetical protein [Austropuccinia psidii MF-1]